jgi:hypothetical protein
MIICKKSRSRLKICVRVRSQKAADLQEVKKQTDDICSQEDVKQAAAGWMMMSYYYA